ncbi:type II toxin-antitoxin system PemI/MazE family antitoxin [Lactobacillus helveticus]|uniref:type II toxin-antitoxin system PemI/MazE family antitoxin n=1 Tax=Lactobacillus helveticus TaxID=1587 RepID=UPI0015626891|nr:transcription elongation factor GreAB [Lactobacillus helveticus]NRO04936.1 hypothetical protein [Lactobacillus helveticus]NRO19415.1 hypothetical protein [Lactobacillus helveticus]NRO39464.1 hypothetical protein [Lactobacillus helveticus]NRO49265.1 hypothetical protein [Lactobacillus helveticus]NRO59174.1 hypothetical protein [Lactobacillus helveticus]
MFKSKVVKRGNSLALSLSEADKKFSLNSNWIFIPQKNGSYVVVPKLDDPYASGEAGAYYVSEEWSDINQSDVE